MTACMTFESDTGAIRFERLSTAKGVPYIWACPTGYIGTSDLSEIMQRLAAAPRFTGPLPTLWDFRAHDFGVYDMSEFRARAFILRKLPDRSGAKRGYLVDSETGYGVMRMFQQVIGGYGLEAEDRFRVSFEYDALMDWLTV